ncbi:hypothetical protein TL16_g01988 [Triparma laevis f. inornata]|uniref:Uncharacterized protein n=1 Tax=Triparma laevis f. inornata TaxID=1714386 RepID=A0A9W6ZP25_9STRA|nr:hypothetical protein TL16_g01988 [Triparma laevis f. inornata]
MFPSLLHKLLHLLLFLPFLPFLVLSASPNPTPLETQASASFFLTEIQKLSDSGIYESLTIHNVLSAERESSQFHDSIRLKLNLASPYFLSKQETEEFEVLVMYSKEDKSKSFAINEFPKMNEVDVERHWIKKVKRKKEERKSEYEELKNQAKELLEKHDEYIVGATGYLNSESTPIVELSNSELLHFIDNNPNSPSVAAAKALLQERYLESGVDIANANDDGLRRIIGDANVDPIKRRVAERVLKSRGGAEGNDEL